MSIGRAFLLAVTVLMLACSDEDLSLPPKLSDPQGRVDGIVRVAGQPAQVLVRFSGDRETGSRRVDIRTDSEGNYSVPLPGGNYSMRVNSDYGDLWYTPAGPVGDYRQADTLRVVAGGSTVRADLDLGAIDLRLRLPDWWQNRFFEVTVWTCPDSSAGRPDYLHAEYFYDYSDSISARLGPLLPGSYLLSVDATEISSELWMPGTFRRAEADTIAVAAETPASYSCSLGVRQRIVRGAITGAWESLLGGPPRVSAYLDAETRLNYVYSAADGRFDLPVVAERQVRIQMEIGATARWLGGDSFDHATIIELPDTGGVVLPPVEDRGLRLQLDSSQLQGSGRAQYRLEQASSGFYASYDFDVTIQTVAICGLVPGDYRLRIYPDPFGHMNLLSQWYDRAASPDQAALIHISEADEVVPITATLEPGGLVRGRVSTPDDWWSSVTFVVTDAVRDTCLQYSYAELSTDGSFEILGFPDGAYKLAFGGYGFECGEPLPAGWIWYGQTADWDSAAVITITDHGTVEGIDVELPEFDGDGWGRPAP